MGWGKKWDGALQGVKAALGERLRSACCECHVGKCSMPAFLAVFEVHDSDVEGLLRSLRDESQAMNDGVVLLRGLPFTSTEEDIADFFSGNSAWATLFLYQAFSSLS